MADPGSVDRPVERIVADEVRRAVARRRGHDVALGASNRLREDLGLTSIDLVEILLGLERTLALSTDALRSAPGVRTVGDLTTACRRAANGLSRAAADDPALIASRNRAEARRRRSTR